MVNKILVVGDLHIKKNIDDSVLLSGIRELVLTVNPDLVVFLGDTLDTHEKIDLGCLNRAISLFSDVAKTHEIVVLIGNHDRRNNSDYMSNYHPFVGIENIYSKKKIHIVYKTELIHGILFVPYVPPGRFRDAIENFYIYGEDNINKIKLIFAHQEFRGAKMGSMISNEGDKWREDEPFIISGHIHDYQELQNNIIYVGTPMQHRYGESTNKALMLLELDNNGEIEKITRKPVPGITILRTLRIHYKKLLELTDEQYDKIVDKRYKTRLIIEIGSSQLKNLAKLPIYNKLLKIIDKVVSKVKIETKEVEDRQVNVKDNIWDILKDKMPDDEHMEQLIKLL